MSNYTNLHNNGNVIKFPRPKIQASFKEVDETTPVTDKMICEQETMNQLSKYKSNFNWDPIKKLELREQKKPIRGGFIFKSPVKLVNSHSTCQQCLYAFEIDTYGRGCVHNCLYCYAKAELSSHGYWNTPYPVPVDINIIRKMFYTTFETDKKNKWRAILERRIPLRIGSMSDSFMYMDKKLGVSKELLKILNFYQYPYLIFTRSDLIVQHEYLKLIDPKLGVVQFSISSVNEKLNKIIEPGAPSAKRRFNALKILNNSGIWTTVRINPIFPEYPDGYYSDPSFNKNGNVPYFPFSSVEIIDYAADANVPAILVGFGRFRASAMNHIGKATKFDFRSLFNKGIPYGRGNKEYHFSDEEITHYYMKYRKRCIEKGIQFTTCYIGNGEHFFWKDQHTWSNKKDCCNVKGRIHAFKSDCREIPFEERLKHNNFKCQKPIDPKNLHTELGDQIDNQPLNL